MTIFAVIPGGHWYFQRRLPGGGGITSQRSSSKPKPQCAHCRAKQIHCIGRTVVDVAVKIVIVVRPAGVLTDEPSSRRVIIPRPQIEKAGLCIKFPTSVAEWIYCGSTRSCVLPKGI